MEFAGKEELVKKVQSSLGLVADGKDGPLTWNAIAGVLVKESQPAKEVTVSDSGLSPKAYQLILDYEVGGGEGYYNKFLKRPTYPGGASGVTIGIGYDLGYNNITQFESDWKDLLLDNNYIKLKEQLGKKSSDANHSIAYVRNIEIPWSAASQVFNKSTLPRFINETKRVFAGSEKLCPDAFGALVSLIFNRGGSTSGSTRVEMYNIQQALKGNKQVDNIYSYISSQIRSMKRLWVGKGLDGLLTRREKEAQLVESCK